MKKIYMYNEALRGASCAGLYRAQPSPVVNIEFNIRYFTQEKFPIHVSYTTLKVHLIILLVKILKNYSKQ